MPKYWVSDRVIISIDVLVEADSAEKAQAKARKWPRWVLDNDGRLMYTQVWDSEWEEEILFVEAH
jgi:hypothetical protein